MLSHFDVDGIPAVFAKRSGPLNAGLVFRVGRADETLAIAGITHMTEHLALHRFGLADYHIGGSTGPDDTTFQMQGSEAEVASFLSGVCASLGDLPMNRLETEKSILRTESAGERRGGGQLYRHRYGAQGYGLLDYLELGVPRLQADEVVHWARTWFTRDNAILWVAGETVPAGLRLRLPGGVRRPVPARPAILNATPAYFAAGEGQVVFSSVVRHSAAARIFAKVLERELFRSLRQEGGFSYTAATSYHLRGDGFADIIALADALPDKQDAVLGGVIDVLAQFKVGRIDPRDIEAVRAKAESSLYGADAVAARLPAQAANLLSGLPYQSREAEIAELRTVDVAAVHAVAAEAFHTTLLRTPAGRCADWAGFTLVSRRSQSSLTGQRFPAADNPDTQLVLAPDAAGVETPDGSTTVRFADSAAMLAWPDGARQLIGKDGSIVRLEPTLVNGLTPELLARVDHAVGPRKMIHQPARHPDEIPRPAGSTPRSPASSPSAKSASNVLLVVTAIFGLFALLTTAGLLMDSPSSADGWAGAVVLWLVCALFAFLAIKRRRLRS